MSETFTTETLREKLVNTLNGLQSGDVTPAQAHAVVKVSNAIIETAKMELEVAKTQSVLDKKGVEANAGPLLLVSDSTEVVETGPSEDIVMSHYDDGIKPADIAKLVGSDIRTVTEIINSNK